MYVYSLKLGYKRTLSHYFTLGVQGFKLFFRFTWQPFEEAFDTIEARFLNHTLAVVRLANVDYQSRTLEYQRREGNDCIILDFNLFSGLLT